jgi:hypothetical protein
MKMHHHWVAVYTARLGYLASFILYLAYGESDFSSVSHKGLFAVGYREFHVKKTSCAVSVYYPMDKPVF